MLGIFSHWEVIVVLAIVLLLFGTRIPKLARSLGLGLGEFKRGVRGLKEESGIAEVSCAVKGVRDTVDPRRASVRLRDSLLSEAAPPEDSGRTEPAQEDDRQT